MGTDSGEAAARRAINRADWREAERLLRSQLASAPASPEPHFLLGYVLFRQKRAVDSLAEYTAAARLRQPTSGELIFVASDYILLKDFADAERWLRYATEHDPTLAYAWYLLGRAEYSLDHSAEAATAFTRCLQLQPHDVRAEYNLGLAYEHLDRAAEAEQAYRTAIAWQTGTSNQDAQPFLDLGMLLLLQHRAEAALDPLRQAVALAPGNALAQQEFGLAFEAAGRDAEALISLGRAAQLAPEASRPHFFLGRVYRRLGKEAEAAAQFAEVSRLAGAHSEVETPNDPQPITAGP